ncbi:hypothetical protein HIM_04878 [Hirsutella minnesotensis 3608]|uniref:Phospholipase/carboxylesterase/thioesterase domain-containing protein n=1 Tax=Hirsutella minnesotensis 3608 TaxID=1043627 RepID=A0A0F7ZKX0_9HYPO|nr:hypothetical protein HIM_04878 [Hirsutella minnesotensis 3608]
MNIVTSDREPLPPGETSMFIHRPSAPHTHTVILLHDVASNGRIFGGDLLRLGKTSAGKTLPQLFPGVRFVFPTAPRRQCHAIGQLKTTLWFDVARFEEPRYRQELQRRGLCSSARQLINLVNWEAGFVPAQNIVIGGLGQGMAVSLTVIMVMACKLGGVIGLSGFLPFQFELLMNITEDSSTDDSDDSSNDGGQGACNSPNANEDTATATTVTSNNNNNTGGNNGNSDETPDLGCNTPIVQAQIHERLLLGIRSDEPPSRDQTSLGTPIFLGHGKADAMIAWRHGELAFEAMRTVEYEVVWKHYDGLGHGYDVPREIDDIVDFLNTKVGLEPRT